MIGGDGRHDADRVVTDRLSAPGRDLDYRLADGGRALLAGLGVALPAPAPDGTIGLRYCVDWTEQRHHLAGTVGRALTARLVELDWLRRAARSRAVHVTDRGRAGLRDVFGALVAD